MSRAAYFTVLSGDDAICSFPGPSKGSPPGPGHGEKMLEMGHGRDRVSPSISHEVMGLIIREMQIKTTIYFLK